MFRWLVGLAMAMPCVLFASDSSQAVTRTYQSAGVDNEWFNAANWSPSGLPAEDDDLTVNAGSPTTTSTVNVDGGGTLTIGGSGVTASFAELAVGADGMGELTIDAGAVVTGTLGRVGRNANSLGGATITGQGTTWTLTSGLVAGLFADSDGTIGVLDRAVVDSQQFFSLAEFANTQGAMYVEDATVMTGGFADVGKRGLGFLELAAGASFTSSSDFALAREATGAGTALVSSSTITARAFIIGGAGTGTLDLSGGATATATGSGSGSVFRVGDVLGGEGDIFLDGVGTHLDVGASSAQIGNRGMGTIEITQGAQLTSGSGFVGTFGGSSDGTVTIIDAGSQWTVAAQLEVGREGTGLLEIFSGGRVTAASLRVGSEVGGSGIVSLSGSSSTLELTGAMDVGVNGPGRIELIDDAILTAGSLKLHNLGTLAGQGTVESNLVNEGTIAPGLSPGKLFVFGDYQESATATLAIELAGTVPELEHDVLDVIGLATLAGDLTVSLLDDFSPQASDTFSILTSSAIGGAFANVASGATLTTTDGMGEFTVHYGAGSPFDPGQVVLTDFQPLITGGVDTEPDGDVDGADFLTLQRTNPALIPSWQTEYGSGTVSSSIAVVPEPASLLLLLAAMCLGSGRRVS